MKKRKDKAIEKLKDLQDELHHKFGVSKIGVFGSYARGENEKDSDIDILVEFDRSVNLFEFARLKMFLSEQMGLKVDLVTPDALKPMIKESILNNTIYL